MVVASWVSFRFKIGTKPRTLHQNTDKARTPANDSVGKGSSLVRGVDTGLDVSSGW